METTERKIKMTTALFDRLRRATQAIDESLLSTCKRWGAASLVVAYAVACIVFGCVYSFTPNMVLAMRQGFAFFWLTFGVCLFVSTFGIARWLGARNSER